MMKMDNSVDVFPVKTRCFSIAICVLGGCVTSCEGLKRPLCSVTLGRDKASVTHRAIGGLVSFHRFGLGE